MTRALVRKIKAPEESKDTVKVNKVSDVPSRLHGTLAPRDDIKSQM